MTNKITRRKPGYTKNGEIKIVSLSVKQLIDLQEKTQQNKKRAKIQRRIDLLKRRPGYVDPVAEVVAQATE